jgi:hypothetical protein
LHASARKSGEQQREKLKQKINKNKKNETGFFDSGNINDICYAGV